MREGDVNIGGFNSSVSGSAIGRNARVTNVAAGTTAEDYAARLDALRRSLLVEAAEQSDPDLALADALAALTWLRQHYADQAKPAGADERIGTLRKVGKVWKELVDMAKQLPAGILAGWIVEAMK